MPTPKKPDPTPDPTPDPSPEAQGLLDAGAAPTNVDSAALLAQIQKLQARVDSMSADQGIPSDPVAATLKNLHEHAKVRKDMSHSDALDDLLELLSEAQESTDALTVDDAQTLIYECDDIPSTIEGHDYLRRLARDLRREIVNRG